MLREGGQWREATWDEALARAAQILRDNGADKLGMLVHPATSNEEGELLARLAEALGTGNLDHRIAQQELSAGAVAEPFAMPVADIEQADAIVIVGSNLRHELPLVHARVRKATLRGAKVHVVNPVDFDFAFEVASKAIVAPSQLAGALRGVSLAGATRPVVIVGGVAESGAQAAAVRKAARDFAAANNAALCRIPQGANALGLARQGVLPRSRDARAMLSDARGAYIVYGIEPGLDFADQGQALKALGGAQVVAFSHFACESTLAVADVILPIGMLPEVDATLTNLEGREQRAVAAGKLPGEARAGWRVLRALGGTLGAAGFDFTGLDEVRASLARSGAARIDGHATGAKQGWFQVDEVETLEAAHRSAEGTGTGAAAGGRGLEIAASQAIYRGDAILRRAAALQAHPLTVGARIAMHPADAQAAGLADGAMAKVAAGQGTATLPVAVDARVAAGCAWIESGYGATAPLLSAGKVEVARA
jgi:NADH-quinone oxidoreductase subunit G